MKIVPSEFSISAWNYFLLSKKIAYDNHQQNVDSENLLLAIIRQDSFTIEILKKNGVNIKKIEEELIFSLNKKAKMRDKQENLYIGETLYKIFLKAYESMISFGDVVISTEHLLYGLAYDEVCGKLILNKKKIPDFLEIINKMKSDPTIKNNFENSNESLDKFGIDLTKSAREGNLDPVIGRDEEIRRTCLLYTSDAADE